MEFGRFSVETRKIDTIVKFLVVDHRILFGFELKLVAYLDLGTEPIHIYI